MRPVSDLLSRQREITSGARQALVVDAESLFLKSSDGDIRHLSRVLAPSDSSHQEPTAGQLPPRQRTRHRPLDILGQTTTPSPLGEGALHPQAYREEAP